LFNFCIVLKFSWGFLKRLSWIEAASVKFSSTCQFLVISHPVSEVSGNWKETNSPRKPQNRKQHHAWEIATELRKPLSAKQMLKMNGDVCWLKGGVKSDNPLGVFHSACTFHFTKAKVGKKMYITENHHKPAQFTSFFCPKAFFRLLPFPGTSRH